MLDGALTIGSPEAEHITWRTPAEVFEIKLRDIITERLHWEKLTSKKDKNSLTRIAE